MCSLKPPRHISTLPIASFYPEPATSGLARENEHSHDRRACFKGANRRHRACTPLDSFLSEDLAFTRKGQSEHDFSCWANAIAASRRRACARSRWVAFNEQLRIRFYIHQNFPGDDFGISKIKVKQACLNKLQYFIVRRIGAFAVLEYHHSDTDTFAPIQYIIRSKSVRFP